MIRSIGREQPSYSGNDGPACIIVFPGGREFHLKNFDCAPSINRPLIQFFFLMFFSLIVPAFINCLPISSCRTSQRDFHIDITHRGHTPISPSSSIASSPKCILIKCHYSPFHPKPSSTLLIQLPLRLESFHTKATFRQADR